MWRLAGHNVHSNLPRPLPPTLHPEHYQTILYTPAPIPRTLSSGSGCLRS